MADNEPTPNSAPSRATKDFANGCSGCVVLLLVVVGVVKGCNKANDEMTVSDLRSKVSVLRKDRLIRLERAGIVEYLWEKEERSVRLVCRGSTDIVEAVVVRVPIETAEQRKEGILTENDATMIFLAALVRQISGAHIDPIAGIADWVATLDARVVAVQPATKVFGSIPVQLEIAPLDHSRLLFTFTFTLHT